MGLPTVPNFLGHPGLWVILSHPGQLQSPITASSGQYYCNWAKTQGNFAGDTAVDNGPVCPKLGLLGSFVKM